MINITDVQTRLQTAKDNKNPLELLALSLSALRPSLEIFALVGSDCSQRSNNIKIFILDPRQLYSWERFYD